MNICSTLQRCREYAIAAWADYKKTWDMPNIVQMIPFSNEQRAMGIVTAKIDDMVKDNISQTIIFYVNQTLQTIALCYKDFDTWPPYGMDSSADDEVCVSL